MRRHLLTLFLLIGIGSGLSAQNRGPHHQELGFWVGGSSPLPGTKLDDVIDANLGMGLYYRIRWPWILMTETGLSYTFFSSRATERVSVMPIYAALVYQLPIPGKLETFIKAGGGTTELRVWPYQKKGWENSFYGGIEASLSAGRHLRLGLRLDYDYIVETNKKPPNQDELYKYWLYSRATAPNAVPVDPRFLQPQQFDIIDGRFYKFGIMMSFIL